MVKHVFPQVTGAMANKGLSSYEEFRGAMLKETGELENTLVMVTSDNGMAFPRAKANVYEYGIHMPLTICWPANSSPTCAVACGPPAPSS